MRRVGATLHGGARASHCRGLSCCGAQAPDAQAQQLWLTGLVAPWPVGSSQTRARTCVPCIGRQIPNHCATREALDQTFLRSQPIVEVWKLEVKHNSQLSGWHCTFGGSYSGLRSGPWHCGLRSLNPEVI